MIELPDELDLYSFFEVDPERCDEFGDLVAYTVCNDDGLCLIFSCNTTLADVGVVLLLHGTEIIRVTAADATSVVLRKDKSGHSLVIKFDSGYFSEAQIWVKPAIKVRWASSFG